MNPLRLVFAVVAVGCLLMPATLPADDAEAPFAMEKHYSADLAIITSAGVAVQSKTYVDGDKMRSDVTLNGMQMAIIVRKDKQKIYQVLDAQKMVMEMAYDPSSMMGRTAGSFGPEGTFKLIGPDTVDGVVCTKYAVTSDKTKQVFHFWLDTARKVPVQMAAVDGALTVKWKNFAAGPQNAALFEPPAGYQVMSMSGMPGAGQ
jgi:outer membrane lipoprotein-sorting protein